MQLHSKVMIVKKMDLLVRFLFSGEFSSNLVAYPKIQCKLRLKLKLFKICSSSHVTLPSLV